MANRIIGMLLRIFLRRQLGIETRRRRRRGPLAWLIYLIIVAILAVVLWSVVPRSLWNTIYQIYGKGEVPE